MAFKSESWFALNGHQCDYSTGPEGALHGIEHFWSLSSGAMYQISLAINELNVKHH